MNFKEVMSRNLKKGFSSLNKGFSKFVNTESRIDERGLARPIQKEEIKINEKSKSSGFIKGVFAGIGSVLGFIGGVGKSATNKLKSSSENANIFLLFFVFTVLTYFTDFYSNFTREIVIVMSVINLTLGVLLLRKTGYSWVAMLLFVFEMGIVELLHYQPTWIFDKLIIIKIIPIWPTVIFVFYLMEVFSEDEITTIHKAILITVFISMIVFSVPYYSKITEKYGVAISQHKADYAAAFEKFNDIKTQGIEQVNNVKGYWSKWFACFTKYMIGGDPAGFQGCMQPPKNESDLVNVDPACLDELNKDISDISFNKGYYSRTEFGEFDSTIDVTYLLKVNSPQKPINIDLSCYYSWYDENGTKINKTGKIDASYSTQNKGNKIMLSEVTFGDIDVICSLPNELENNEYQVTAIATIRGLDNEAVIKNLYVSKESLDNQVRAYAAENHLNIINEYDLISAQRNIFPNLIEAAYKCSRGDVQSVAKKGFVEPALETTKQPIIGTYSNLGVFLKLGLKNQNSGNIIKLNKVSFKLPQDIQIIQNGCEGYSNSGEEYVLNKKVDISKISTNKPFGLPACKLNLGNIKLINVNEPEMRTIDMEINYDYRLESRQVVRIDKPIIESQKEIVVQNTSTKKIILKQVKE